MFVNWMVTYMNDLVLYKSERFGNYICDFWEDDNNQILMSSEQLGTVLGFTNPSKGISNLVNRNEYLKDFEFSSTLALRTEAGMRETRLFTEDGIYEVAFLSGTNKAKEFRSWVRKLLKAIHHGEIQLLQKQLEDSQPKLQFYQQVCDGCNHMTILQASKLLKISGRNKLFKILREESILMNKGERHNLQ